VRTALFVLSDAKKSDRAEHRQTAFNILISKDKVAFKQLREKPGLVDQYYQFNYEDGNEYPVSFTISTLSQKVFWKTLVKLIRKRAGRYLAYT